jgi:hypothetical protein
VGCQPSLADIPGRGEPGRGWLAAWPKRGFKFTSQICFEYQIITDHD